MGRFPNIAASKAKTGALKGKLYGMYAKEIYQAAKNGGTSIDGNLALRRLVEKAKKEQVPQDVIKRAIDKVNSGADENYVTKRYELFGPSGSNLIVDCLTDNENRTVSNIRAAINKTDAKMGSMGSVAFMYDNLAVLAFKGISEEEALNVLIENDLDADMEMQDDLLYLYGNPTDLNNLKEAIISYKEVEFEVDEISMLPKSTITLSGESKEDFQKLLNLLDDIDDVNHVYHNVELGD